MIFSTSEPGMLFFAENRKKSFCVSKTKKASALSLTRSLSFIVSTMRMRVRALMMGVS